MQDLQPSTAVAPEDKKISAEQLDSLVAPIALYPDPLLSQTLVASTYPLEIIQLQQWLDRNKGLKDKALTDAVMKEDWDPSVQAMAVFPDTVKILADNIRWTNDLGNAFLAQQSEVMEAVQRMRAKAMQKGALSSTEQQKVETKVVEEKTYIVVEPSSPEVVYVPAYEPSAIWGDPFYPYPPIAYPPYYPTGGRLLSFGVGVAIGAAWGNGGWGWGPGWGGGNVYINNRNNFINHYDNNRTNAGNRYGGGNNNWQHNPQHRGGAPYADQRTAQRFGGNTRGESLGQRQNTARQGGGQLGGGRPAGSAGFQGGARPSQQPSLNRGPGGGGGDRIGNRQVSPGNMGSRNNNAFSGASNRSASRASSSRGMSSMGSRGGSFGGGRGGGRGGRR